MMRWDSLPRSAELLTETQSNLRGRKNLKWERLSDNRDAWGGSDSRNHAELRDYPASIDRERIPGFSSESRRASCRNLLPSPFH